MLCYCIVLYCMVCMYVCIHIFICYLHVLFIRVLSQAMVVISQCFFFRNSNHGRRISTTTISSSSWPCLWPRMLRSWKPMRCDKTWENPLEIHQKWRFLVVSSWENHQKWRFLVVYSWEIHRYNGFHSL